MIKDVLLDVDAMLSCVSAQLANHVNSQLPLSAPDCEKARAEIDSARDKILKLAEILEAQPNN